MEKLITILTLKLIFKNEKTVVDLYKKIYPDNKISPKTDIKIKSKPNLGTVIKTKNNKQEELLDALTYLKSKKRKTKKEKPFQINEKDFE